MRMSGGDGAPTTSCNAWTCSAIWATVGVSKIAPSGRSHPHVLRIRETS
jgi:hypothetical protein